MKDLKLAYIQTSLVWEDKPANYSRFDEYFEAIGKGTDLIVLPEMFNTGFSINPALCAETMDGSGVKYIRQKSKKFKTVVIASLMITEKGKLLNRLMAARPDGSMEIYDKRHLFRLSEEYKIFTGGSQRLVMDINGWKVRPLICYDLRFPVWSKNTFSNGAYEFDLLLYVANWPSVRSKVWTTLLAARAMENQVFCAGVNRVGTDGNGAKHSGDSAVFDPKGNILSTVPANEEGVAIVNLPGSELELVRSSFTVGMDWDSFRIKT
jgi:predicted amidohydrolase